MTIYHFDRIKIEEPVFYSINENQLKGFRGALASWMHKVRENKFIVIRCKQLVRRDINGKKIFLGVEVTREI